MPVRVFLLLLSAQQTAYYRWAEREYERMHPEVDVIFEQFPGTSLKDYEIKLRLRFRARQAPDVFQYSENGLAPFAAEGLLAPAPDYIERIVRENSVNELVRNAPYYDGVCYGVAHDASWTALYYNKQMFREAGLDPERPPRSWAELLDYADRLTVRRPDGSIARAGLSLRKTGYKPGTAGKWQTFFYSAGGQDFAPDGFSVGYDSPAGRAAMEFYRQVLFERRVDAVDLEGDQQAFGQGAAAMFIREIHVVPWLEEHHPDVEFGVAPIPARDTSLSQGAALPVVVSSDSKNPEAAWRFVEFLMSDEPYARYVGATRSLPCTRSVAERPAFRDDPILRVFMAQAVQPPPKVAHDRRSADVLGEYVERFCYGQIAGPEALRRATRDINAGLARYR